MWRRRVAALRAHVVVSSGLDHVPFPGDIPDPPHDPDAGDTHGPAGRPGNSPLGPKVQGYGIRGRHPPPFDPRTQAEEAAAFYFENGYVLVNALSEKEVADLNLVADEFVRDRGQEIDVPGQGQLVFPLLEYPEFDFTVVHPNTLPLVERILGGKDKPRLIEFNYRGWEPEERWVRADSTAPPRPIGMTWHPDGVPGPQGRVLSRSARRPYGPPDLLSTFTYLTDVDETTPAFGVVPKSRRTGNIQELKAQLGDEYCEVPIYGKAGTCCIVDRVTIHTRVDPVYPDPSKGRRIYHHVFARAGALNNADGSPRPENTALEFTAGSYARGLVPQRLAESPDPDVRRLYSLWSDTQREWAATGYDPDFVSDPKAARGPTRGIYLNPGHYKQPGAEGVQLKTEMKRK